MVLYALCLHPLLRTLELQLTGFAHIRGTPPTPIVAYADDVTILVTQPTDFDIIHSALQTYGRASGAILNPLKSRALAVANWSVPATVLGITFHPEVKILGVSFGSTINKSIRQLEENNPSSECHRTEVFSPNPLSGAANPVCTDVSFRQDMVLGPKPSTDYQSSQAVGCNSFLVHVAWRHLSGPIVHAPARDETGWMGHGKHRSQM